MEETSIQLGLELKHEFETTIVTEYVDGSSVLQIGIEPHVAVNLARANYKVTICAYNTKVMNTISTLAIRDTLPITLKDYDNT